MTEDEPDPFDELARKAGIISWKGNNRVWQVTDDSKVDEECVLGTIYIETEREDKGDERMTAEFLKKILSEDPPPDFGEPSNQEEIDGEMFPQFYRTFGTDEICPRCGREIAYTLLEYHPYQPILQDTLIMFCDCGRGAQTYQTRGCPFFIRHDDMREFMHLLCERHLELLERYDERMRSKQKEMDGGSERPGAGSSWVFTPPSSWWPSSCYL